MERTNGQDKWDINRINKYVQITCTYVEMCITHTQTCTALATSSAHTCLLVLFIAAALFKCPLLGSSKLSVVIEMGCCDH